ncbi:Peptide chain release factor 1 [Frankliniella fusca]|uniref:Peptide chain release factor 1 n=1 Tax=Frankliniella fusca TaxID=407009 RepID=A0AAE1GYD9_9NEOP|nr:Peptide chain release factor 1 [Frankliniella fusca]
MEKLFVVVKNHESGKLCIRDASDLYILNADYTRCKKWVPTNNFDKKAVYGIPFKQNMIVHSLLAIHENPDKLQEKIDNREIRNSRRYSVDQTRIPMSKLKLLEGSSAGAQMSTKCTGNCDMVSFLKQELSLAHERIRTLESERSQVLLKLDKNLSSIAAKIQCQMG